MGVTRPVIEYGIIWDEASLDKFLKRPAGFVRGTKMLYAGMSNEEDRAELVCYLKQATHPPGK